MSSYKDELQARIKQLLSIANESDDENCPYEPIPEWEYKFIKSVNEKAFMTGVLSLSPKQLQKVEELYDRYCT